MARGEVAYSPLAGGTPPFTLHVEVQRTSHRRVLVSAATVVVALAAVILVLSVGGSEDGTSLDYHDGMIRRALQVSNPPAFDPRAGEMFGKLMKLAFDCVKELKRSFKGRRMNPDYDAIAEVHSVETMLHHLMKRLGIYDIPYPRIGSAIDANRRRASFTIAVKKCRLLKRLVRFIPPQDSMATKTERQVRYGVLKYDLEQISEALWRIVNELLDQQFSAVEPRHTAVHTAISEIDHSKVGTDTPVFHPPSWHDVFDETRQHIIRGSVEDVPSEGGANGELPRSAMHGGGAKGGTVLKTFNFHGTMDPKGNLVGTLSPK